MKKFLTSIALLFIATASFAQATDQESEFHSSNNAKDIKQLCGEVDNGPKHRAYVNPSVSWTPGYKPSYTLEAGTWGMSSYTSFGGIIDVVVVDRRAQYWVGVKPYYTIFQNEKLTYMLYVAPKYNLTTGSTMLEYGINQNYTLSKDWLLGVTLGNQLTEDGNNMTFLSLGILYLFPKK